MAERIVIASPYPPAHDEALSGYLKTFGFDVLAARGANLPFKDIQVQTPHEIYEFVKRAIADNPKCDTVYLACPQWQAAQVAAAIEQDTGRTAIAYSTPTSMRRAREWASPSTYAAMAVCWRRCRRRLRGEHER